MYEIYFNYAAIDFIIVLQQLTDEKTCGVDWKLCAMRGNVSRRVHENKIGFLVESDNSTDNRRILGLLTVMEEK